MISPKKWTYVFGFVMENAESNRSMMDIMRQLRRRGGRGERWWVCTLVNICIYTIFIEFFRLNANLHIDLTCQGLISEPQLKYVVRWKGLHIRPTTGIEVFGNSTLYLFKNTILSILFQKHNVADTICQRLMRKSTDPILLDDSAISFLLGI